MPFDGIYEKFRGELFFVLATGNCRLKEFPVLHLFKELNNK